MILNVSLQKFDKPDDGGQVPHTIHVIIYATEPSNCLPALCCYLTASLFVSRQGCVAVVPLITRNFVSH